MTRMFFNTENCQGVTSGKTGISYNAKNGFIDAHPADVAMLKAGGYVVAGGLPRLGKYWVCDECDWEAALNHCRFCDSTDLRKVEQ